MTTTPLPPLPEPDIWSHVVTVWRDEVECQIDQGPRYTADQMQAYATQARADLEAENQRLREALQNIKHMKTFAIETTSSWCPLATEMVEIARAALEKQP